MKDMPAQESASREQAMLWRATDLGDLEVLRAQYISHSFARHSHAEYMVGIIEQGACAFYYRGAIHAAPTGSIVVINPGEVHDGSGGAAISLKYRALYPSMSLVQQATYDIAGRHRQQPYFPEPVIQDEPLSRLVQHLHLILENSASALERETHFLSTLAHLLSRHSENRPACSPIGKERLAVRRARNYLEAHPTENITLAELAGVSNLSPFHLLRVFRVEMGLPPHAYLTQLRVATAKRLLTWSLPIPQVAVVAGFSDQSHLTRHFKRLVGVTPGHYLLGRLG